MENTIQNTVAKKITLKQYVMDGLSVIFNIREEAKPLAVSKEHEEKPEEWNYLLQLISL